MAADARERRYWGFVPPAPAPGITFLAKQAEEQGLEGVFAPQVMGPPWVPLGSSVSSSPPVRQDSSTKSSGPIASPSFSAPPPWR